MAESPFIRKVKIISDPAEASHNVGGNEICVVVNGNEIIGITDEYGQISTNTIVAKLSNIADLMKVVAVARIQLLKRLDLPGIVIINQNNQIEGIIHRREIANFASKNSERGPLPELAGGNSKVPFVIYVCPKRDYEFIPFEGIPDHVCPNHKLVLIPERIIINV